MWGSNSRPWRYQHHALPTALTGHPCETEKAWEILKTILKGSSFCTFGRVMYKTKTPVKFVDNCKSMCSLFLLRSRIMCEPFESDFKTILKGSSFCTFGRVMYKTKTPVKFAENRIFCCSLFRGSCLNLFQAISRRLWRGLRFWVLGLRSSFCTHPLYRRFFLMQEIRIIQSILYQPFLFLNFG